LDGDGFDAPPTERQGRRGSMAADAILTYATNIGTAFLSLASVLIISRSLGPSARGEVAFLITVSTITGMMAGLSVQESNANLGGSHPGFRSRLATNSLIIALLCGLGATVIVVGVVALFPRVGGPVPRVLLYTALATTTILIAKQFLSFLIQSEYGFRATNLAWLSGPLTSVTFNGLFAALGWLTVERSFLIWISGQVLGLLILLNYVARNAGFGPPDLPLARRALGFGLKTHPVRLMGVGSYRADQWFVGAISGSRELGLYSVAVAWAEALFYLPGVLTLVQRPDLVRATRADAAQQAARVFRVAAMLSIVCAAGLFVTAPILCKVIFGSAFSGSIDDLRILAFGAIGIAAVDIFANALTAQRLPMLASAAIGVSFVLTLALDIALIPHFGGAGAAAATSVAYTFGGLAAAMIFARAFDLSPRELLPRLSEARLFGRRLAARLGRG
jgi:O-antigen/teichoic acid export membrane protein